MDNAQQALQHLETAINLLQSAEQTQEVEVTVENLLEIAKDIEIYLL